MPDSQPEWGRVTPRRKASDAPPPPFPLGDDPRTAKCQHAWGTGWGEVGERQRQCVRCERWVWDHDWKDSADA